MNKKEEPTISVYQLIAELQPFANKGYDLTFNGLTYYRPKMRGEKLVQIEFNETVYLDDEGHVVVETH